MSGYKKATVTISEEEYRRLHQADMKRRFKGHTRNQSRDSAETAELASALRHMEARQQWLEQALSELDDGSDQVQLEAMEEIRNQNALHYEHMLALLQETASETHESIAAASQRLAEEMQRGREDYRERLQALVQRLDTYEDREEARAELADGWLRQSRVLADFIVNHFDHDRFMPGRLNRILASLDFAESNLAQGFLESSLQGSQQAFLELSELHVQLEQRLVEWQVEYHRAYQALNQFVEEVAGNSCVSGIGLEGEELADEVDVARWSNGRYHELLRECQERLADLTQGERDMTTAELNEMYMQWLPERRDSFESILYDVRWMALNSQLRMNIAEKALQALEMHGFQLSQSGYLNDDMQSPFQAELDGSDGTQVTIRVLPSDKPAGELTNELEVITQHPYIKSEQEARLQWEELSRGLDQLNLSVSRPSIGKAPPMQADEQEQAELPAQPKAHLIGSKRL